MLAVKKRNNPFVSVVLANYNGASYIRNCLRSLLQSSFVDYEVIIIDNHSTDNSIEVAHEFIRKDRRIKLIQNEINIGVPASRNRAIQECRGDILVFLDNDIELRENSLEELIKPLVRNKDIGAAQALLLDFKNREIIQMAGGRLMPQAIWLICFYQWQRYEKVKNELNFNNDIIAISAFLAVKREVVEVIRGYDAALLNYTDDLDFSWRIWIAGFRVVLACKSIAYHHTKSVERRANIGTNNFDIYYQLAKNSLRSVLKNYEAVNVLKYLPISILINISRGLLVFIRRGELSALLATFCAIFWNIKTLPDTFTERKQIQSKRKFSDKKIMEKVFVQDNLFEIYNKNFKDSKLLW